MRLFQPGGYRQEPPVAAGKRLETRAERVLQLLYKAQSVSLVTTHP